MVALNLTRIRFVRLSSHAGCLLSILLGFHPCLVPQGYASRNVTTGVARAGSTASFSSRFAANDLKLVP